MTDSWTGEPDVLEDSSESAVVEPLPEPEPELEPDSEPELEPASARVLAAASARSRRASAVTRSRTLSSGGRCASVRSKGVRR